jgi:hypothetical protein
VIVRPGEHPLIATANSSGVFLLLKPGLTARVLP